MSILRRRARGYTLAELIIVIAVLGLAGALLVPNMINHDVMRAEAAVRQLISDINFAQSDALAHQEYRRIYFYPDGSGYCIVRVSEGNFDDPFNAGTADYVEDPLSSAGNGGLYIIDYVSDDRWAGVSISDVDVDGGTNSFLTYDQLGGTVRSGLVPGTGGTVELSHSDGATYELTVSPFTGKLSVQKTS